MAGYISRDTALESLAISILELAKEFIPVDTGSLRDSGKVEKYGEGYRISFGQGYKISNIEGGGEYYGLINYATYVHECEDHLHPNGGQAKFLENAAYIVLNESVSNDYAVEITIETGITIGANPNCVAVYIAETQIGDEDEQKMPGFKLGAEFGKVDPIKTKKSHVVARYDTTDSVLNYVETLLGRHIPYPIRLLKRLLEADGGSGRLPGVFTRHQPKIIRLAERIIK